MITQERDTPVRTSPVTSISEATAPAAPLRCRLKKIRDQRYFTVGNRGFNLTFPSWLRGRSEVPAWQLTLTAILIVATIALTAVRPHHHPAKSESAPVSSGAVAPAISDSLPVELPVPAPVTSSQTRPASGPDVATQIAGLSDSSQELLKQIQQAQHDYATLRSQIQQQDQSLTTVQTEAAATDAERAAQQQQLKSETSATVKTASDQLAKLNQGVTALDEQANLLRKTLGLRQGTYPAVTVPDLMASPDPAQAFDAALASIEAHINAVTQDLQTVNKTAQSQLAFAQSVRVVPVGAGTSVHGTGQLSWPTTGTISQNFGPTSLTLEPAYGGYAHFHLGVDIANSQGTPIAAAAAGTVIFAGWTDVGYGNMVEIDHGNGLVTIYGHMMTTPSVRTGQRVFKGQLIGYMGTTGNSTGPHLHFGVQYNGAWVDPFKYMP